MSSRAGQMTGTGRVSTSYGALLKVALQDVATTEGVVAQHALSRC